MRKINVGDELFIVEMGNLALLKKGEQFPNDRVKQLKEEIADLRDELSDVISEKEELEDREYAIRQEIEAKTSAIEAAISQSKEQAQEAARHRMTATCDHCHVFSFEARQTDAGIFCPACAEVTAAQIPAFLR